MFEPQLRTDEAETTKLHSKYNRRSAKRIQILQSENRQVSHVQIKDLNSVNTLQPRLESQQIPSRETFAEH